MELNDLLEKRHSTRKYDTTYEIPSGMIESIKWAGSRAPYASGGPRRVIYTVSDQETKDKLYEACFQQKYVKECSTIFVICGKDEDKILRSGHPKYVHDCDAMCMCMILKCVDLGLGNCWIGHFDVNEVRKVLNCNERPTIVLLVGKEKKE